MVLTGKTCPEVRAIRRIANQNDHMMLDLLEKKNIPQKSYWHVF
jgi:hypothetical protein